MTPGAALNQKVVAEAFKKTNRYGLTGFKEMETAKKPRALVLGISGMT